MKKYVNVILALVLVVSMFSGCVGTTDSGEDSDGGNDVSSNSDSASSDDSQGSSEEDQVLKIFQFKVEMAEQFAALAKEYESTHPGITVEVETVGGGADYATVLKSKFASGDYPDIFNNYGDNELEIWIDRLEDLSDQPWIDRLVSGTADGMTKDGKIYGMPFNLEGYGYIYNKDVFEQAGIETLPSTLEEFSEACEKLKAIDVIPFSNGFQEWWVLANHNFNSMLANQEDPKAFVEGLRNGTVSLIDNEVANNWVELLDLAIANGQKNALTVDYNTQVTDFATGKCAIIKQGNWIQNQLSEITPDMNVGILPMPVASGVNDSIYVGVPNNWVVYKESEVKDIAKDFLNWMVTSDIGKRYQVEEFKFIPAFVDIETNEEALGGIASAVSEYTQSGKVLGWYWAGLPSGYQQEVSGFMQEYIAGGISKEEMFENIENTITSLN
jgi:raffinose/stachyose/melibiose transport system substrate-binding protein